MDGRDFKSSVCKWGANERVVFRDAEGKFHDIHSWQRVRADGVPMVILRETFSGDYPFILKEPPKELLEYMYNKGI